MRTAVYSLFALLVGAIALHTGLGLQASLLGIRAEIERFPVVVIGLIMASYYTGFIFGSIWCPTLVARVGHIRAFSALASVASAATLSHAALLNPWIWVVLRTVTGFCLAGLTMVAESWLNERTDNRNRGTVLSIYMICILGGTTAGQLLLNVALPASYDLFVVVSILISLSLVPVATTTIVAPRDIERRGMTFGGLVRQAPLGAAACIASGMMLGSFWSLGTVYARGIGLDTYQISLFMTSMVAGGTLFQWPVGRLSDRIDRRLVIAGLCLLLAATAALAGLGRIPAGEPIIGFMVLFGGLLLPLYGLSVAHANDRLEPRQFLAASATLLTLYGVGASIGPLLASGLMQLAGPRGLFFPPVIVGSAVGGYALYRVRHYAAPIEPEPFIAVPRTSPIAYEMDPRSPPHHVGGDEVE